MSPPDNRRSCFLRELSVADFVPPEDCVIAVNALTGTALPVSSGSSLTPGFGFGKEVEQFVTAYWSLPPAERRARWADLSRQATGALAARVRRLELGLDVSATPHPDPGAEEVASLIRSLFLLPPREQAIRRAQWLGERADRSQSVIAAARQVQARDLPTAWLDPIFFDWVTRETLPVPVPLSAPFEAAREDARELLPTRRRPAPIQSHSDVWEFVVRHRLILLLGCCFLFGFIKAMVERKADPSVRAPGTLRNVRPYTPPARGNTPRSSRPPAPPEAIPEVEGENSFKLPSSSINFSRMKEQAGSAPGDRPTGPTAAPTNRR